MTPPSGSPPAATGPALTPPPGPLERRARRLLRWYPAGWRARYGEEFAELLLAELSEQPRAWRRTADVARCGITARLAGAGLAGPPAGMAGARASLGTLACSLAVFLTFGTAMWAQLAVGWQWAPPDSTATSVAMLVMSRLAACPGRARAARRRRGRLGGHRGGFPGAGAEPARTRAAHRGRGARPGDRRPSFRQRLAPVPAAIGGRTRVSRPAESPRSAGRPRCRSRRTGPTRPPWPPSRPPSSPGWCSARPRYSAWPLGPCS